MSEALASSRYAKALFNLAAKEKALLKIDAVLSDLVRATEEHPEIKAILRSPVLKEIEKNGFIQKIIPVDCPALLKDFLRLLIEKKRFPILDGIFLEFHRMFEAEQGLLEIQVLSVVPFSKPVQEKLKKVLEGKLRSEIRLIPRTDASLLGGFLLRFNGKEIDCSFRSRIREIGQMLLQS